MAKPSRIGRRTHLKTVAALGVALLLMLALTLFVLMWWIGRPLERRLNALRAQGEPTTMEELSAQLDRDQPDGRKTALLIQEAGEMAIRLQMQFRPILQRKAPGIALTKDELAQIEARNEQFGQLLAKVREAVERPTYRSISLLNRASLDDVEKKRSICWMLQLHVEYALARNHAEEAFDTCITMFELARQLEHEPFMLGHLVARGARGIAIESTLLVLRASQLTETQRAALDEELARHDSWEPFRKALKEERAFMLLKSDRILRRKPWFRGRATSLALDLIDKELAMSGKPQRERPPIAPKPKRMPWEWSAIFADSIAGSFEAAGKADYATIARVRALRILNQLLRVEMERPAESITLDMLGLPDEAMIDPFDGQPMRLRRDQRGWVVYSVGDNLVDDGGEVDSRKGSKADVGVGPPLAPVDIEHSDDLPTAGEPAETP